MNHLRDDDDGGGGAQALRVRDARGDHVVPSGMDHLVLRLFQRALDHGRGSQHAEEGMEGTVRDEGEHRGGSTQGVEAGEGNDHGKEGTAHVGEGGRG